MTQWTKRSKHCAAPLKCGKRESVGEHLLGPKLIPIVYSEHYTISLPGAQNLTLFDLHKYRKIFHQLIEDRLRKPDEFLVPGKIAQEELLLVHSPAYISGFSDPEEVGRALEAESVGLLPPKMVQERIVDTFLHASGGTVLAARRALERGLAVNLAGGYQHASSEAGGGFCLIADVPIAIRLLQKERLIEKAMVVDCDLHQGQGTASIFRDDGSVFILDFFEEENYPFTPSEARRPVPFEYGLNDDDYLALLEKNLPECIEEFQPCVIFYIAGTDVFREDALGNQNLSEEGILHRDLYVFEQARIHDIPIVMVLSGGYSPKSWRIHYKTIAALIEKYEKR